MSVVWGVVVRLRSAGPRVLYLSAAVLSAVQGFSTLVVCPAVCVVLAALWLRLRLWLCWRCGLPRGPPRSCFRASVRCFGSWGSVRSVFCGRWMPVCSAALLARRAPADDLQGRGRGPEQRPMRVVLLTRGLWLDFCGAVTGSEKTRCCG